MTGSFMRFYKKLKPTIIFGWLCIYLLPFNIAHAQDQTANLPTKSAQSKLLIQSATLERKAENLLLHTAIDIQFSQAIDKALLKGFTLQYILEFQLSVPRKYWFSDEIVTITRPIEVRYHALSRQYILVENGQRSSFANLSALAAGMRQLSPIQVIPISQLEADKPYEAALLIRLDYRQLPSAIQDQAKSDWQMTSQRAHWQPSLFE